MTLDKNKFGLIVGCFFAIVHAVWALCIAVMSNTLQTFLDWIFKLHFLKPLYVLTAFNIKDAILLVLVTFIFGYILGYLFATLSNWLKKNK